MSAHDVQHVDSRSVWPRIAEGVLSPAVGTLGCGATTADLLLVTVSRTHDGDSPEDNFSYFEYLELTQPLRPSSCFCAIRDSLLVWRPYITAHRSTVDAPVVATLGRVIFRPSLLYGALMIATLYRAAINPSANRASTSRHTTQRVSIFEPD